LKVRRRLYRGRVARPKGGKTRTLRLTRPMADALRDRRDDRGDDDLVFTTERGHQINGSTLMGRVLKPAAVAAGLGEMVESPKSKDGLRASSWVRVPHVSAHVRHGSDRRREVAARAGPGVSRPRRHRDDPAATTSICSATTCRTGAAFSSSRRGRCSTRCAPPDRQGDPDDSR
jgi:integrase